MDTMMWVIVAGAVAIALGMAVVAWRLLRSDRDRTEARAAMLRQMAFEPEPELEDRVFQAPTFAAIEPTFGATADRTIAVSQAVRTARASRRTRPGLDLQLHHALGRKGQQLADKVAVRPLLDQFD